MTLTDGGGLGSARVGARVSSKAAFVKTNPLPNPAVRMTNVVPTPAKKTTAFEAIGVFLLYDYERTDVA